MVSSLPRPSLGAKESTSSAHSKSQQHSKADQPPKQRDLGGLVSALCVEVETVESSVMVLYGFFGDVPRKL